MRYVVMMDRACGARCLPGLFRTQEAAYRHACVCAKQLWTPIHIYSDDTRTRYVTVYPGNVPEDFLPWDN